MNALETERELVERIQTTARAAAAANGEVNRLTPVPGRAERAWVVAEQDGIDAAKAEAAYHAAVADLKRAEVRAVAAKRNAEAAEQQLKQHRLDHVVALMPAREELSERATASLTEAQEAIARAGVDWHAAKAAWSQLQEGVRRRAMAAGTDPPDWKVQVGDFPLRLDPQLRYEAPTARVPRPPILEPAATNEPEVIEADLNMAALSQ